MLAVAWPAAVGLLLFWIGQTPLHLLREQLKSLQFWSLELCVALGVVFAALLGRDLRSLLNKRDALRVGALTLLALALTLFVAPRTNRIFYDEQIYQGVGQNLSDLKLAQSCNDGTVDYGRLQCWSGEYNKQPYAYPHLLSLGYRIFGVHPWGAFVTNAAVMALTSVAVYLLVVVMFGDRVAAFSAGLLIALTPEQIIWSATAAVEPSASLAGVIAVLCAAIFVRWKTTAALGALGVATAYAVQFRPESLLVVPIVGLVLWPVRSEVRRQRSWWVALMVLLLVAVHIGHLFAVRNEGWGTTDARLSLRYVAANLAVNGWFYLADERFPLTFSLLAAAGVSGPVLRRERLVIGAWFLLFFVIFLLFYAGSYNYGADVRYSLLTYPPIAVLGGLGLARGAAWVRRIIRPPLEATALLTAAVVLQFSWYAPLVRATTEEAWAARADVAFAKSFVSGLGEHSYVLTHNPAMFHVWGVNAGQMSRIVIDPGYLAAISTRYSGGVYLHWNFWCNVQDVHQQEFCRQALATGPFEVVQEYRVRDQRFVLYRYMPQRIESR